MPSEQREISSGPPVANRFRPGQSGNPGGRPKARPVSRALRALLRSSASAPLPAPRNRAEALAQAILERALAGDSRALVLLLDRVEGRVPQVLAAQVSTEPWPAVVIEIHDDGPRPQE